MRKGLFTLGVFLVAALSVGRADACSCRGPGTPAEVRQFIASIPLIFWARAITQKEQGRYTIYTLEVAAPRGVLPVRVKLRTARSTATCGVRFQLLTPVMVGASRHGKLLTANACTQYGLYRNRAVVEKLLRACKPFGRCPRK